MYTQRRRNNKVYYRCPHCNNNKYIILLKYWFYKENQHVTVVHRKVYSHIMIDKNGIIEPRLLISSSNNDTRSKYNNNKNKLKIEYFISCNGMRNDYKSCLYSIKLKNELINNK